MFRRTASAYVVRRRHLYPPECRSPVPCLNRAGLFGATALSTPGHDQTFASAIACCALDQPRSPRAVGVAENSKRTYVRPSPGCNPGFHDSRNCPECANGAGFDSPVSDSAVSGGDQPGGRARAPADISCRQAVVVLRSRLVGGRREWLDGCDSVRSTSSRQSAAHPGAACPAACGRSGGGSRAIARTPDGTRHTVSRCADARRSHYGLGR